MNASLNTLAEHPAWKSGLGISSHVGALAPDLVQDVEHVTAAEEMRPFFDYIEEEDPNPNVNPVLFQSCLDRFGGCCRSLPTWSVTMKLVQQLDIGMENNKVTSCCLMSLSVRGNLASSSSSSSSAKEMKNSWYMIGSICKKPLCHVLGEVEHYNRITANVCILVFCVTEFTGPAAPEAIRHWKLATSHEVLNQFADSANMNDKLPTLIIDVGLHHFQCVGSLRHPNHFEYDPHPFSSFSIGPSIVLSRTQKRAEDQTNTRVTFGFAGLVFDAAKPSQTKAGPRSKQAASSDAKSRCPKAKAKSQGKKEKQRTQEKDNETEAEGPPESENAENKHAFVDDPNPVELPPAAENELQNVLASLAAHANESSRVADEAEAEQLPEETKENPKEKDAEAQSQPEAFERPFFYIRKGLSDLSVSKRHMVCYNCGHRIEKGNWRFEYHYSEYKPPRSVHPDCVGQICKDSIEQSLDWLDEKKKAFADTRSGREAIPLIERAVAVLSALACA